MHLKVYRLEKIIKILVQHLQNPNKEYLIQILELLKENETVNKPLFEEDQTPYPPTTEQLLTQQLLDELQNK